MVWARRVRICVEVGHKGVDFYTQNIKGKSKGKVTPLQARCGPKVGTGIALLFHDHGTRRGWVFSSTPRPYFTPGKDPVPIVQEAGWALGPVWTGAEILATTGIRSPDRPARSKSLYRLSYPAHTYTKYYGALIATDLGSIRLCLGLHKLKSFCSHVTNSVHKETKTITQGSM
jgi:hypothetical protein